MTEEEWLTSTNPVQMCEFLQNATTNIRTRWQGWKSTKRFSFRIGKVRQIAQACFASVAHLTHVSAEATRAQHMLVQVFLGESPIHQLFDLVATAWIADSETREPGDAEVKQRTIQHRMADIVRDVLGNPFRSVAIDPTWKTWSDGAVLRIAKTIDKEGTYADLPILGDALQDAGCEDTAILEHCRKKEGHVRGCWVVALVLGKE